MDYTLEHTVSDTYEEGKQHSVMVHVWGMDSCQVEKLKKTMDSMKHECSGCKECKYVEV